MKQDLVGMLQKIIDDIEATEKDISYIESIKAEKLVSGEGLDDSDIDFDVSSYMKTVYEEIEV